MTRPCRYRRSMLPFPMTVCIAAMSPTAGVIVAVADFLLSNDVRSIESRQIKMQTLVANSWHCLYAGDPTIFFELSSYIENDLGVMNVTPSCTDVMAAVEKSYEAALEHKIERKILAPLGLTRQELMQDGRKRLGGALFRKIVSEIRENGVIDLETHLLVFGFDADLKPHLFSADSYGDCTLHDAVGFHAVGAGSLAALGWLSMNSNFRFDKKVTEIGYRLCEAKFVAETARSVGGYTLLVALFPDGVTTHIVLLDNGDAIRKSWESRRNQPGTPEALAEIRGALKAELEKRGDTRSI
jgi:hypothetical protein